MNGRLLTLGVVLLLAVAALVTWSSRERAADVPSYAAHAAPAAAQRAEDAAHVELAAVAEQGAGTAARREAEVAEAAPTLATILVRFAARETRAPLAGEHCFAREATASTAWVAIDASEGGVGQWLRSGDDGLVRLRVPPGSYVVTPEASGVDPATVDDVRAGETREVVFDVPTRCDLVAHVLVLDAELETPLTDVAIEIVGVPGTVADATLTARTGADGRAALRLPSWTPVSGDIEHAPYGPLVFQPTAHHAAPDAALRLLLARAATLSGEVLDAGGAPVADAVVRLECYRGALGARDTELGIDVGGRSTDFSKRAWSAPTRADGRFALAGLPPRTHLELVVERGGEAVVEGSVQLEAGEEREVAYRLGGARVRGVVLDAAGAPCARARLVRLPGARSRLQNRWDDAEQTALTGHDGTFELDEVPAGDWLVGPKHGTELAPWLTHVHVPAGARTVDVVLRVPRKLALSGRAVGPDGAPAAGAHLSARGTGVYATAKSGADGTFRFDHLVEGELAVEAERGPGDLVGAEPVRAEAGDTDVLVRLVAGGTLYVRVRDADGRPVAAEVSSTTLAGDPGLGKIYFASTDAEGLAVRTGLPPGRHLVLARVEGGAVAAGGPVRTMAGERTSLELTVRPGGRLAVRAPEGAERYRVIAAGMPADFDTLSPGVAATTKSLPQGLVTVEVLRAGEVIASREVEVRARATIEVAFD